MHPRQRVPHLLPPRPRRPWERLRRPREPRQPLIQPLVRPWRPQQRPRLCGRSRRQCTTRPMRPRRPQRREVAVAAMVIGVATVLQIRGGFPTTSGAPPGPRQRGSRPGMTVSSGGWRIGASRSLGSKTCLYPDLAGLPHRYGLRAVRGAAPMIPRSLKKGASCVGGWGMFMDIQEAEGRVPEQHAQQQCIHSGCRNVAAQQCEWNCCAAHCAA